MDLNPLAVISARANYILSISDLVFELGYDIELPIYLADSINLPVEKEDDEGSKYLEYILETELQSFTLELPWELVHEQVMGEVLLACEESIAHEQTYESFLRSIGKITKVKPLLSKQVETRLARFYEVIKSLEDKDWDKIWCRIIKNNFSPKGFSAFDVIIGNPPWVRWSRLPETYRSRVKDFCNYYGLVSGRGYSGGIESDISTVITFSAADNWLKDGGTIAFLITWTVFKSGSARGFRLSKLPDDSGLKIVLIEDLSRIQPFPDAVNETAVYIAKKVRPAKEAQFREIECKVWLPKRGKAHIPTEENLGEVINRCEIRDGFACPVKEWGTPLFTGEMSTFRQSAFLRGESEYFRVAHRGVITELSRVYMGKGFKIFRSNRACVYSIANRTRIAQGKGC